MQRLAAWMTIPALSMACLLAVLTAGGWQSWQFAREHRALKQELAVLGGTPPVTPRGDSAKTEAEIGKMRAAIDHQAALLHAAEAKVADAGRALPPLKGEELRSLGRIEDLAQRTAELIEGIQKNLLPASGDAGRKMTEEESARLMETAMRSTESIGVIAEMEDDPQEIAAVHAATIAARLQLDPATRDRVQRQITEEFQQLAAAGLVCSKRPPLDQEADWRKLRNERVHAAATRIEALIPVAQRRPWVVEQSLEFGNALKRDVKVGADGHGSVNFSIVLPGMEQAL